MGRQNSPLQPVLPGQRGTEGCPFRLPAVTTQKLLRQLHRPNPTLESTLRSIFKERDDTRSLGLVELSRNQGDIYSYMHGTEMKLLKCVRRECIFT